MALYDKKSSMQVNVTRSRIVVRSDGDLILQPQEQTKIINRYICIIARMSESYIIKLCYVFVHVH